MARPIGIIEFKPRKRRKDIGKKRKFYRGKPCKHQKKRKYSRRSGNKDSIILWFQPKGIMSRDGYHNWKSHLRPKLHKEVTYWNKTKPIRVNLNYINTKEKLEQYTAQNYWSGDKGQPQKFNVMGVSHGKTKTHFKWVKVCVIVVKESKDGNVANIIESTRLHKYGWFYKN